MLALRHIIHKPEMVSYVAHLQYALPFPPRTGKICITCGTRVPASPILHVQLLSLHVPKVRRYGDFCVPSVIGCARVQRDLE